VDISDGTLVVRFHSSVGTNKTLLYARTGVWKINARTKVDDDEEEDDDGTGKLAVSGEQSSKYKPVFILTTAEASKEEVEQFHQFLKKYNISVLNVCGHRILSKTVESKLLSTLQLMFIANHHDG
jgi:hypothetical protein